MTADEKDALSSWSREEDKAFENALATHPEDSADWWEKISADVPGRTLEEVKHHYDLLVQDVNRIESGCVPIPSYSSSSEGSTSHAGDDGAGKKGGHFGHFGSETSRAGGQSRSDLERRKGLAWTEDEHRLFLLGLDKYGKGDWRSISRNFVMTRNPTQVASHAQKYFIRLNSMNKDRRRSSIHDITCVSNGDLSAPRAPITGQNNNAAAAPFGIPSLQPQPPAGLPAVGGYVAPAIGQPFGGPLVSAVGTPVNLPAPPHMAYGVRAPVPGALVPCTTMNMAAMPHTMPPAPSHR